MDQCETGLTFKPDSSRVFHLTTSCSGPAKYSFVKFSLVVVISIAVAC